MESLDRLRRSGRAWIEENCPASLRGSGSGISPWEDGVLSANPDLQLWFQRLGEKGWMAPTWPVEYGGGGLSSAEARVVIEEISTAKCPPPPSSNETTMLGPVLLEYANEEQKREHLPKIGRGERIWCQGYSEPGSGSDLAGLQTRAEDKGDHYLVTGSKIWTSGADHADWIYCLVRTDPGAEKHAGISFLLFDMKSPGVSVAPIQLISGESEFCQVFFENVEVPKRNLVGGLGAGWTIAKRLLQFERAMVAGATSEAGSAGENYRLRGSAADVDLADLAKEQLGESEGRVADLLIRDAIVQNMMDQICISATISRSAAEGKGAEGPGVASSFFKYYSSELAKRRYELLVSIRGIQALGWEGEGFNDVELATAREWLNSKARSIEGGTSEIQLNIVAKRVLGLPD